MDMGMQLDRLRQMPELFRTRAEADGRHNPIAGLVWNQAADIAQELVQQLLAESVTINTAAREYGWNYEALRRKVGLNPVLNAGSAGDPRVTLETMAKLGRGRGPRGATQREQSGNDSHANGSSESSDRETTNKVPDPASDRLAEILRLAEQSRRD